VSPSFGVALAEYRVRKFFHQQRFACLFDLARKSLELWFDNARASDNTIVLDFETVTGATCPVPG